MDTPISEEAERFFNESLRNHPIGSFLGQCESACALPVAVEFECGECCKIACGARILGICDGLLVLAAFCPPGIAIEVLGECGVRTIHFAQFVLIPWERVCAVEIGIRKAPPPGANS